MNPASLLQDASSVSGFALDKTTSCVSVHEALEQEDTMSWNPEAVKLQRWWSYRENSAVRPFDYPVSAVPIRSKVRETPKLRGLAKIYKQACFSRQCLDALIETLKKGIIYSFIKKFHFLSLYLENDYSESNHFLICHFKSVMVSGVPDVA